jgi:type I restriction enzyme, R subunit
METPSFKEDHISQVPALQFLQQVGYTYLTAEEALYLRGNKTSQVLLEEVLRKQLKEINSVKVSSTKTTVFSDANIEAGIQALKELPMNEGYMAACEAAYKLLTLGKALEQSIDGDKKSFTLQYIDWQHSENNVFHVTEEFSVMRSTSKEHYRPDLVLFVNGIPLCVIECKRHFTTPAQPAGRRDPESVRLRATHTEPGYAPGRVRHQCYARKILGRLGRKVRPDCR